MLIDHGGELQYCVTASLLGAGTGPGSTIAITLLTTILKLKSKRKESSYRIGIRGFIRVRSIDPFISPCKRDLLVVSTIKGPFNIGRNTTPLFIKADLQGFTAIFFF